MEGVGARLGRSSRYGPAAVFSGPVRKWKKTWVPLSSSSSSSSQPHNISSSNANTGAKANASRGNNASHLVLCKWAPVSSPASAPKDDAPEEPLRRKFHYVPVSVMEEQKQEAVELVDEENKPNDNAEKDPSPEESKEPKADDTEEKPDVNDMPVEETQAPSMDQAAPQLNETNLDLSLGLKAHEGDQSTDKSEANSSGDAEMKTVSNPEPANKNKRKSMAPYLEMRV